jgi:serine-type D-Ala-D-Ala carboxypeptidase (penicillin-binding protein 5/6)
VLSALAIILVLVRGLEAEKAPSLSIHSVIGTSIRIAGPVPHLSWPNEGQAAVEVQGIGQLGTHGQQTPVPIASVAKIMTAYLTLERYPLRADQNGFVMTVTPRDVEQEQQRAALGQSVLPVRAGERIDERQALEALLLPSANNVASMLAEQDAGSQEAFVAHMNASAAELGMTSTTYADSSGFDPDTVSTAVDQLKLARVAMRERPFAQIVRQAQANLPVIGEVDNFDGLVGEEGYIGIKTGSDRAAGGCLVFAKHLNVDGRHLVVLGAVLGQRDGSLIDAALSSARRLGDSVAGAVRVSTLLAAGTRVLTATGTGSQQTDVVTTSALKAIGWGGLTVPIQMRLKPTPSHLMTGQLVTTIRAGSANPMVTNAVAHSAVSSPSLGWRIAHLF